MLKTIIKSRKHLLIIYNFINRFVDLKKNIIIILKEKANECSCSITLKYIFNAVLCGENNIFVKMFYTRSID